MKSRVLLLCLAMSFPAQAEIVLRSNAVDASTARFGNHLDVDGELAVVGSPWEDVNTVSDAGAAHVFRRNGAGWAEVERLTADAPQALGWFGQAVALDGDTIVIGAPTTTVATLSNRGQAQIFRRTAGTYHWALITTIIAPGGAAQDVFGDEVAIEGNFIAVGAPRADLVGKIDAGKVYIYQRDGTYLQTLSPTDAGAGDQFGDRISMTADYLFIAAPEDDLGTATNAGSVYIYKRSGTTWAFSQKLVLTDAARDDFFGNDVAANGDRAVVACRGDDTPTLGSGAAYAYRREGTNWVLDGPRLTPPNPRMFDVFASSVALQGDKIIVGASGDDEAGSSVGAVHVFHRPTTTWSHASKRMPTLPNGIATLGGSVAVSGNTILAGAASSNPSGTAHSFKLEVNPLIFVPGIAASKLTRISDGQQVWPSVRPNRIRELALSQALINNPTVQAVDIGRYYYPIIDGLNFARQDIYQPFIDYLIQDGHVEFQLAETPSRLSSTYMLDSPQDPKPTLFPFPYDWRLSCAVNAVALRTYLDRIRQLYPNREVDIVAHSMGGLVTRRMILNSQVGVGRVATVGSPIWGAPAAIERILAGRFFDKWYLDPITNNAIKDVLATFPSFYELLPAALYSQSTAIPLINELGWDYNENFNDWEEYDRTMFETLSAEKARPPASMSNHTTWHARTGQDDWRADPTPLSYLQVAGLQQTDDTVYQVRASGHTIPTETPPRIYTSLTALYGPGDGTVPVVSASRILPTINYQAPGTIYRLVSDTNDAANHSALLSNHKIQGFVSQFFDGALPITEIAPTTSPASSPQGFSRIRLRGCGYTRVRDALGNENTKLSELAALHIPNVTINYGGENPWMDVTMPASTALQVDGPSSARAMDAEILTFNPTGGATSLQRYRFTPSNAPWLLNMPLNGPGVLTIDNGNGISDPADIIPPTHAIPLGQAVDVQAPTLTLLISALAQLVTFTFQAQDAGNVATPSIRYRLANGPLQTYGQPLVLTKSTQQTIFAFAEDSAGNISGPIATSAQPPLLAGPGNSGLIDLHWSAGDGFVLESAPSLTGPWSVVTVPQSHVDGTVHASVPIGPFTKQFFRLKSGKTVIR